MVGRDVLIGILAGLIQVTIVIARFRISERAAPVDTLIAALESLESVPDFANIALTYQVLYALQFALAASVMIFAAIPFAPGGSPPFGWELVPVLAGPLLGFAVLLRFGLLAHCASLFTSVLVRVPMTLDFDAWYFGHSLVVLLVLLSLATYGFLVSLGGRPAFGGTAA